MDSSHAISHHDSIIERETQEKIEKPLNPIVTYMVPPETHKLFWSSCTQMSDASGPCPGVISCRAVGIEGWPALDGTGIVK